PCSGCKRKSSEGEREKVVHCSAERSRKIPAHCCHLRDSSTVLRSAQNDRLTRYAARGRNSNPAHRRSRKSRSRVRSNAAQHRIYGRRSTCGAVRIGVGKIGPAGAGGLAIGKMWRCAPDQTFEFHESQRISTLFCCAVLQN